MSTVGNWEPTDNWKENENVYVPLLWDNHFSYFRTSPFCLMYKVVLIEMTFCFANFFLIIINCQHLYVLLDNFILHQIISFPFLLWYKIIVGKIAIISEVHNI